MIDQEFLNSKLLLFTWVVDHDKLIFLQAIKIINYRMKNKNSDNLKPEELNIDSLIDNVKNNK